ncbi:MAG: chemotaxis protein CheW [Sandaracinaceae bacterium]|nr:chemotaxis protein CheW [Sandaracinaceae bacterium]
MSAEAEIERILRERAALLASRALTAATREVVARVIAVRRGRSVLALPILAVDEVREARITRLPHRSRHVCGLFQLRGEVIGLVDLAPFYGPTEELRHGEIVLAVVVRAAQGRMGLRVDEVLGPRVIHTDELDTSHRPHDREHDHVAHELVAHVTRDCTEILDIDRLFASEALRLEANHEREA